MRHHSRTISGKQQIVVNSFAKCLEVIPRTIADNAGLDSIQVLNKLRQKHAHDGIYPFILANIFIVFINQKKDGLELVLIALMVFVMLMKNSFGNH